MAYDSKLNDVILLEVPYPPYDGPALTWAYSGGIWTNLTATSGTPPPEPAGGRMAFDPGDGNLVEFGGMNYTLVNNTFLYQPGTWVYGGGNWSELSGTTPNPRTYPNVAYDPELQALVIFGGYGPSGYLNDTWAFTNGTWSMLNATGPSPDAPGIDEGTATFDSGDGYLLYLAAFGYAQTWVLGNPPPFVKLTVSSLSIEANESYQVGATVVTNVLPLTFDYTQLPPGCIGGNSSQIPCVSPIAGSFEVLATITNGAGLETNASEQVIIGPGLAVSALVATPNLLHVGGAVVFSASLSGGSPPYVVSYSGLPPTCPSQNSTRFSCSFENQGTYSVIVTAVDSIGLKATRQVNVTADPFPTLSGFSVSPGWTDFGDAVAIATAVDGGAPPISYDYAGLPPNCTGNSNRPVLTCRATSVGLWNVSVTATDALGARTETATAELNVRPDPTVTSLNLTPSQAPLGRTVVVSLEVSGGVPPLIASWTGVPSGCPELGASFSCVPLEAGKFLLTVSVVDSLGQRCNASATLLVLPAASASGSLSPAWIVAPAVGLAAVISYLVLRRRKEQPAN